MPDRAGALSRGLAAGGGRTSLDPATGRELWKKFEVGLAVLVVLLKLRVLYQGWGELQGYDAATWLSTFRATHWFEPLPTPRALLASYAPPLSYLLTRVVYAAYPHEVEASQVVSTGAAILSVLALRSAVRGTGQLWTVRGLWLVYGGASIPLMVWMAMETGSYDVLALGLFMVVLSVSVRLYWQRPLVCWLRDPARAARMALLGMALALGCLNKFTGLLGFGLPFLVILVRRGPRALLRELDGPLVAVAIGATIVAPLYYHRYYQTEGKLFPASMEWQLAGTLKAQRALRDSNPTGFLKRMLKLPANPKAVGNDEAAGSLPFLLWRQTWRRPAELGTQPVPSRRISNFYLRGVPCAAGVGGLWLLLRGRQLARPWRAWGWLLAAVTAAYWVSALAFAWEYPVFGWGVFKAKYMSPAVLWLPWVAVLPLTDGVFCLKRGWKTGATVAAMLALLAFVITNHWLPVY